MSRKRSWAGETQITDFSSANTKAMRDAATIAAHHSIEDAVETLGSNRELALALIQTRGGVPDKKAINSQMRSIQRWLNYERGITDKQHQKPSKMGQGMVNHVVNNSLIEDGATVQVSVAGQISVNGYVRDYRECDFDMSEHVDAEEMLDFLDNPTWEGLAAGYGVNELHGFGDVTIEIILS